MTSSRIPFIAAGIALALAIAAPAFAQTAAEPDPAAELEAARERAKEFADPQSVEQERWQDAINDRIRVLQEWIRTRADVAALPDAESIPGRASAAQTSLDSLRGLGDPQPVRLGDPEELVEFEQRLAEFEAARTAATSAHSDLDQRVVQVTAERNELPARASDIEARLTALTGEDAVTTYRRDTRRLEAEVVNERVEFVRIALEVWVELLPVLETEKTVAELRYERTSVRVAEARDQVAELRGREVQQQLDEAESRALAAEDETDPIERFRLRMESEIAAANASASLIRSGIPRIAGQITAEKDVLASLEALALRLEARIGLGADKTESVLRGAMRRLREMQVQLQQVAQPAAQSGLEANQSELALVLDRIWELQLESDGNRTLFLLLQDAGREKEALARQAYEEMTRGDGGLLRALRAKQDALNESVVANLELLGLVDKRLQRIVELKTFVRTSLLWSRTSPALSMTAAREIAAEIRTLGDYAPRTDYRKALRDQVKRTGLAVIGVVLGLLLMVWGGQWRALGASETGDALSKHRIRRHIIRGLAWAGGLPVALWAVSSWQFAVTPDGSPSTLGVLFSGIAWFLFAQRAATVALSPGGLLDSRLAPFRSAAASGLHAIRTITTAGMFLFVPGVAMSEPPYNWERLTQFILIAAIVVVGVAVGRVFRVHGPVVIAWAEPGTPSRRMLSGIGVLFPAMTFLFVILSLVGYRAGAEVMFQNTIKAVAALLLLMILYRIVEAGSEKLSAVVSRKIILDRGFKAAVETQTKLERFLGRTAAILIIVLAAVVLREAWGIGDMLGELLDAWQLFDAGEGDWVTMLNVVDAAVLILLGFVISQAVTSMWELVIAPLRGNEVAGSEYATLMMIRYAILTIAIAIALLEMKFSAARLGWLLTALSVGLGFGLQEIVANFVSGLILMIERPVRVGDIVTVGPTAGTVGRISIRATMITNWDRQTIIVPNRNFITQEVTNWTRQDQIVRRTMKVGVAFGSDVEQVLSVLDGLVSAHPKVLRSPAHRIWFNGFGESSLDFEVWFYALFEDGLRARTEIFTQICSALREAGIEVPFPVRDVRIRNVDDEASSPTEPAPGAESVEIHPPDEG